MKRELSLVMEGLKIALVPNAYFIGGRYNNAWEWVDNLNADNMNDLLCDTSTTSVDNVLILQHTGVNDKCIDRVVNTRNNGQKIQRRSICVTIPTIIYYHNAI